MRHRSARHRVLLAAAGALVVGPLTIAAAPECDDPVAEILHETHDALGPLGDPVHTVEHVYCDVVD
jgi:hypothetical protein